MSGKEMTLRRLVSAMFALMLLLGMAGSPASAQDPCTPNENNEVADGCTLSAGTLAIWEGVADGSTWIYVGYVPDKGFTVDRANGFNAWSGYDSFEQARNSACDSVVNPRLVKDGFTVYINDVSYTGDLDACKAIDAYGKDPNSGNTGGSSSDSTTTVSNDGGSNSANNGGDLQASMTLSPNVDPKTQEKEMVMDPGTYDPATFAENGITCVSAESVFTRPDVSGNSSSSIYDNETVTELPNGGVAAPTGLAVPAGICVNDGIIVVRAVYAYGVGGYEDVFVMDLDPAKGGVYCGKHGETGYDCWWNYPTKDSAFYASCEVAKGDQEAAMVEGNYIYQGAVVTYFGGPVPSVCR